MEVSLFNQTGSSTSKFGRTHYTISHFHSFPIGLLSISNVIMAELCLVTEQICFCSFPNWLLGDHLGSTSMATDDTGILVSEARYSAFGEIRYDSGTMTTDYLYTGQRQEAEIGLYYYGARWYDPAIGRFIQADSVVPNPGSAKGFDRYAYTFNNPIKYSDPSGHSPVLLDGEQFVETDKSSGISNHISRTITKIDHCSTAKMDPSCQSAKTVNAKPRPPKDPKEIEPLPYDLGGWPDPRLDDPQPQVFYELGYDPSRVDWEGIGLSIYGIVADVAVTIAGPYGSPLAISSTVLEVGATWEALYSGDWGGDDTAFLVVDTVIDGGRIGPPGISTVITGVSILWDLAQGITVEDIK